MIGQISSGSRSFLENWSPVTLSEDRPSTTPAPSVRFQAHEFRQRVERFVGAFPSESDSDRRAISWIQVPYPQVAEFLHVLDSRSALQAMGSIPLSLRADLKALLYRFTKAIPPSSHDLVFEVGQLRDVSRHPHLNPPPSPMPDLAGKVARLAQAVASYRDEERRRRLLFGDSEYEIARAIDIPHPELLEELECRPQEIRFALFHSLPAKDRQCVMDCLTAIDKARSRYIRAVASHLLDKWGRVRSRENGDLAPAASFAIFCSGPSVEAREGFPRQAPTSLIPIKSRRRHKLFSSL